MTIRVPRARRRRIRVLSAVAIPEPVTRPTLADQRPRTTAALVALLGAAAALVAAGPVAGVAVAVYAALAVLALLRRRRTRRAADSTSRALDAVTVLAADLRAGIAPAGALEAARPAFSATGIAAVDRLGERIGIAWLVAETAGAPLADLLDRLEADVRGLERIRRDAAAQAAGAGATALLLAALPVAGIGLGYGMGADPLRVLLRTPVGALCAGLALLLQVAGLLWSDRLARGTGEVA